MKTNRFIVIMAGGVGSRFWPASRESRPKQFLDILGVGQSLIQMTFDRAKRLVPVENIMIATNAKYKSLVKEHLPDIQEERILLEPSRNNTAPCIAYATIKINELNKEGVFGVLPSDHVILKEEEFIKKMNEAFNYAEKEEALLTLGLNPTRPDTGYGYIEIAGAKSEGVNKVAQFREKPNLDTAKEYLNSGKHLWNAGIFIWSTKSVLSAFSENAPQIIDVLSSDLSKINTSEEQAYIDKVYPLTESISVDYALMERSKNVYTIPAEIGWSDLGTWNSLHAYMEKDEAQNVLQGDFLSIADTQNCLVKLPSGKKAVIKGLKDMILILEDDVLLLYPKQDEQEIKSVRNNLKDNSIL